MCSACPKVATQKCAKCKLVYFCNRDCQRRAFPMHKHFCQKPEDCENENLRIVVMENGRMECAGQDRGSRYRTARNYLLQGNSAMDQQQYSEAWGYVQKALVIGKQLKDWTVQSNALRVLSLCCRPMGGPQDSERNVTWWDEALTEARKHGDPFLEAMVLKTMGYAAAQKYGDYRALEESAQLWLAIMKALRLRGESGEPGLRRCPTQMLITKQYLAMGKKKGGGWEGLLREALVYGDMLGNNDDELHQRYCVLQLLANKCETDLDALKSPRGQARTEAAGIALHITFCWREIQLWINSSIQRHVQAWEHVQKALVIGKQLKDWTIQSNALRVLSLCCRPMGGPQDSERNVTWWDEALTEARKHGDPFLEAMVLKTMGYAAAQKFGDYRALEESAQLSIANMKALRLRDESGLPALMGVCGSKSVDSARDSSDSDSEEPSRKPSHQHGVTVAKSEPSGHDIATLDQIKIDMSGPKAGRQRMAIAAEGAFANANVEIVKATKSPAVIDLLDSATQNNLLFEHMLKATKQAIFDSMTSLEVAAGSTIIKQGDTDAKTFYVLGLGTCEVLLQKPEWGKEARQVLTYESGSSFGELALLYSAPRAATVRAVTACQLWVMDRAVYVTLKQRHQRQMTEDKRKAVSQVPMLAVLSQEHKEIIAEALEVVELAAGQNVYMQGDTGSCFYIIKEGCVTCTKTTDPTKPPAVFILNAGQFFGERALLKDEVRAASVTAKSGVVCYTLARKSFDSLLGPIQDVWRFEALRKVPILFSLSNSQLFDLAQCMKYHTLQAGQIVFRKGEPGDVFYVVEEGNITIYDDDENELARVGKGSCFGELALLRQDVRAANVRALSDSLVLTCHRDDFQTHLGRLTDIRRLWRFEALRKVPLLASLNAAQRSDLCTALKPRIFNAGESIVGKGDPGEAFYIVESGTCTVLGDSGQEVMRLGPTMYFGELALLRGEPRAATVAALTDASVLMLAREDFNILLGPLQMLLGQNAALYGPTEATAGVKQAIQLKELKKIALLGAGAFGQVFLVKHNTKYYALKCLSKAHVLETGLQAHVKREKEIQAECNSYFMVNLEASFKDSAYLYMLLECIMGGELFTYLQSRKSPCGEEQVRFYAAAVVSGLQYLQERNLVWRDLKPENLLLDSNGYLKMADFGFAKRLAPGVKTFTLCGTPEYLAPELVTQTGHARPVDWWAAGVLIFEMAAGYPPFYHEDRVAMFRNICQVKYTCPTYFSKELRDLVKRLLTHSPSQRLGSLKGGALDVKAHPWFKDFDWESFEKQTMPAPYIPKVSSPEDTNNFYAAPDAPGAHQVKQKYISTGVFKDF
ncbi:hypothetical protein WJX82_003639 [Trebouxia sp. C0006]